MKTQEKKKLFTLTIIFLTIPALALANAGSPMIWFGMFHLLLLNALIGIIESDIVSKMKVANTAWVIILANYISMFIGLYFIAPHFSTVSGNQDFWGGNTSLGAYKLKGFFIGMVSSYFATLVIEFPFFYLAIKDKQKRKQILFPFLVANTVTNMLIISLYYLIVR